GTDQQAEQRGTGDVDQQGGDDAVTRPRKDKEEARENAHRPARDDERQLPPVDARTGRWGEAHASSKMGLSSATGSSIGTTSSGRCCRCDRRAATDPVKNSRTDSPNPRLRVPSTMRGESIFFAKCLMASAGSPTSCVVDHSTPVASSAFE